MGGFLSALSGAGNAAANYGHQIRQQLEERRSALAQNLFRIAEDEPDPNRRAELHGISADLLTGKDMGKIVPGALKKLVQHHQSNVALAQALGGPPQEPKPQPGPAAPGQVPGRTGTSIQDLLPMVTPQSNQPAAQPGSNPIAGGGQIQPLPTPAATAMAGASQPSPAPPPQAGGVPHSQSMPELLQHFQSMPEYSTPAGRRIIEPLMTHEIQHNEQLQMSEYNRAVKQAQLQQMKATIPRKDLPEHVWAAYEAEAGGLPAVNLPSGFLTPRLFSTATEGPNLPEDATDYLTHQPVDRSPNKWYRVEASPYGGAVYIPTAGPAPSTTQNAQGGMDLRNRFTGNLIRPLAGAVAPGQNTLHTAPTAGGGVETYTAAGLRGGQQPTALPGAVTPSLLPTVTTTPHLVTHTGDNGQIVQEMVPFPTTRTRGGAGSLPPVGGTPSASGPPTTTPSMPSVGRTFDKPLTALQALTEEQRLGQYDNAMTRVQSVIDKLPLLNSLLDSGKLELAMHNGILASVASRGMKLTQAESKLVADFTNLTESVNLLRGPLGATGFRGPEAFAALQAQRGNLLKNPDITRNVLQTFLTELHKQADPIAVKLKKPAPGVNITPLPETASGVPPEVQEVLKSASPGVHKLSDGTRWRKDASGQITKYNQ